MSDVNMLWKGKLLEDLSREELLEVARHLIRRNLERFTPENIRARALGQVEMLKRGER